MSDPVIKHLLNAGAEYRPRDGWQDDVWQRIADESDDHASVTALEMAQSRREPWLAAACAALLVIAVGLSVLIGRQRPDVASSDDGSDVRPVQYRRYSASEALTEVDKRLGRLDREVQALLRQREHAAAAAALRKQRAEERARLEELRDGLVSARDEVRKSEKPHRNRAKKKKAEPKPEPVIARCLTPDSAPFCDVYLDDEGGVVVACDPSDPLCGL